MKKALYEAHKLEKGFCMIYDVTQKTSAPYLNRGRFDFLQTKRCSCTRVQFLKLCKTRIDGNRLDHFTQEFT